MAVIYIVCIYIYSVYIYTVYIYTVYIYIQYIYIENIYIYVYIYVSIYTPSIYVQNEIPASRLGCQFGLARFKVFFGIHLNSGYKTELWTILIQASLCGRMSTTAWKPDWNLFFCWNFWRS